MGRNRGKCLLAWSSGKDCAYALQELRDTPDVEVVGLLTTMNEAFERVAMHAVRAELVAQQAAAVDLPLWTVQLPWPCSNEEYESRMGKVVDRAMDEGITQMAFGDLFLEDVRAYREKQLAPTGLEALFPLWGRPTDDLAAEMVAAGLRAYLTCVDPRQLDPRFAGRAFDAALLDDLPAGVDRCGENGEFHTFVHDGPMFKRAIPVEVGAAVERDGFLFADLQITDAPASRRGR